jgi:hypothetical protein
MLLLFLECIKFLIAAFGQRIIIVMVLARDIFFPKALYEASITQVKLLDD